MRNAGSGSGRHLSIALVVALVGGLATSTAPARASFPGSEGLIAFDSDREGNFEIYTVNPDGTGRINLTQSPGADTNPIWDPLGQRIAFMSERDLNLEAYVMNADGTGVVRLTNHQGQDVLPTFCDANKILFASNRDGDFEIYSIAPDGSGLEQLTDNAADDVLPTCRPDGQKIAFMTGRDGNFEIYEMDPNGANAVNLTQHTGTDQDPEYAPDGTKLYFASNRDGNLEIFSMDLAVGRFGQRTALPPDAQQLTSTNAPAINRDPSASPAGNGILFTQDDGTQRDVVALINQTVQSLPFNYSGFDSSGAIQPRKPDLKVVKEGPGKITQGKTARYRVTVTNEGPGRAEDIVVGDTVEGRGGVISGVSVSGELVSGCQELNDAGVRRVECDIGDLEPGQSRTITIAVSTRSKRTGSIFDTAAALALNGDVNMNDNVSQEVETDVKKKRKRRR